MYIKMSLWCQSYNDDMQFLYNELVDEFITDRYRDDVPEYEQCFLIWFQVYSYVHDPEGREFPDREKYNWMLAYMSLNGIPNPRKILDVLMLYVYPLFLTSAWDPVFQMKSFLTQYNDEFETVMEYMIVHLQSNI